MGVTGSGTRLRVNMSIDTTDHGVAGVRLNFPHRIGTLPPPEGAWLQSRRDEAEDGLTRCRPRTRGQRGGQPPDIQRERCGSARLNLAFDATGHH